MGWESEIISVMKVILENGRDEELESGESGDVRKFLHEAREVLEVMMIVTAMVIEELAKEKQDQRTVERRVNDSKKLTLNFEHEGDRREDLPGSGCRLWI